MRMCHRRVSAMSTLLVALLLSTAAAYSWAARGVHPQPARRLQVFIQPNIAPIAVPFNTSLQLGSPDLPYDDPRIAANGTGCIPEQVGAFRAWVCGLWMSVVCHMMHACKGKAVTTTMCLMLCYLFQHTCMEPSYQKAPRTHHQQTV